MKRESRARSAASAIRTPISDDPDSREKLLLAARKLFARHGFDGTTVRDLAAEAGTNVCMVSYHFGGKDELYRACIERYGRARLDATKNLLEPCNSTEEFRVRFSIFVRTLLETVVAEADVHRILTTEIERGLPNARAVFEDTILELVKRLVKFFKDAQSAGIVRSEVDPFLPTSIIYSTVGHLCRTEVTTARYFHHTLSDPQQRETMAQQLTDIIVGGCLARSK